ncbi:hypothetical protein MTP06_53700 [Streptomyces sp. PLM4]|nr:hypothetical protein MTP06_53700 [Streptomyces sp. PLM4]
MDPDQPLPRELKAADFTPLGRVITREEGLRVVRWAERAPLVRERLLCEVRTGGTARGLVGRSSTALVDLRFDLGVLPELLGDTLGTYRVRSCIRPGRTTPLSRVRPWPSLKVVALMVLCFSLPETNALRPGRPARGRRTRTSVPSMRRPMPSASA